jgi:hypothetical protein
MLTSKFLSNQGRYRLRDLRLLKPHVLFYLSQWL